MNNSIYNMLAFEFGNDSMITIGNKLMNQSGLIQLHHILNIGFLLLLIFVFVIFRVGNQQWQGL